MESTGVYTAFTELVDCDSYKEQEVREPILQG